MNGEPSFSQVELESRFTLVLQVFSHQPADCEQTFCFNPLNWFHRPSDSDDLQYKSMALKRAFCSYSEGWWRVFKSLDLYHRPSDSNDLQYKSMVLNRVFCSHAEGW